MMKRRMACVLVLAALVSAGCDTKPQPPAASAPAEVTQTTTPPTAGDGEALQTFAITGMTCEGCQQTVTDAIASVEGVRSVHVSLDDNTATVIIDAAHAPPPDAIPAAVKGGGYEAALRETP